MISNLGSTGSLLLLSQSCPLLSHPNVSSDGTLLVDLTLPCPQTDLKLCQGVFSFLIIGFGEMLTVVLVERPIDDVRCAVSLVAAASRQTLALSTTVVRFFVVVINV